jgi:hypothetical protein
MAYSVSFSSSSVVLVLDSALIALRPRDGMPGIDPPMPAALPGSEMAI